MRVASQIIQGIKAFLIVVAQLFLQEVTKARK